MSSPMIRKIFLVYESSLNKREILLHFDLFSARCFIFLLFFFFLRNVTLEFLSAEIA